MRDEDLMNRGDHLARLCAMDGVLENQLGLVLAHLKRHRQPAATRALLAALPRSPFAARANQTRHQLEALDRHVGASLGSTTSWEDAAVIVGWAKRLWSVYRRRSH